MLEEKRLAAIQGYREQATKAIDKLLAGEIDLATADLTHRSLSVLLDLLEFERTTGADIRRLRERA